MKKRLSTLVLSLLLAMIMLFTAACSQVQQSAATATPASTETASTAPASTDSGTVQITDAAGRTVTVPSPENLKRVYPTSSTTLVLLYTLAPDMMTASPSTFTDDDAKYVDPEVLNLPSYGTLSGSNGSLDYEAIKAADVQVLLSGCASDISQSDIDEADEMQNQLGIPVVLFDTSDMDQMPESYRLLGQILGRESDAETIIAYFQNIVDKVTNFVSTIPQDQRMTLYYAEGDDGLSTEPASSDRSIVFNTAGANNIAQGEALGGFGQASVSMEQVLGWNPDIIIVQGYSNAYKTITTSSDWANITAVKEGRVYAMPSEPFSWADRPPSENRFIGLLWMTKLLYGDAFDIDIVDSAIDYYKTIYHVDVSRTDMEALLANSIPQN